MRGKLLVRLDGTDSLFSLGHLLSWQYKGQLLRMTLSPIFLTI